MQLLLKNRIAPLSAIRFNEQDIDRKMIITFLVMYELLLY